MGNIASRSMPKSPSAVATSTLQRKLKPLSQQEMDALKRIAEQDQQRMRDLPSSEEIAAKDGSYDGLLSQLGGAVQRSKTAASSVPQSRQQQQLASSSRPEGEEFGVPVAPQGVVRKRAWKEEPLTGRAQSITLQKLLAIKNEAEASGNMESLEQFANEYGLQMNQLETLFQHNCLPLVGKVATFGHQYAFARPPLWFRKQGGDAALGGQFKSEPTFSHAATPSAHLPAPALHHTQPRATQHGGSSTAAIAGTGHGSGSEQAAQQPGQVVDAALHHQQRDGLPQDVR